MYIINQYLLTLQQLYIKTQHKLIHSFLVFGYFIEVYTATKQQYYFQLYQSLSGDVILSKIMGCLKINSMDASPCVSKSIKVRIFYELKVTELSFKMPRVRLH